MARGTLLCLAVVLARIATVSASCYTPAGTLAPNYVACNRGPGDSNCCGNGWFCMTNGMCALDVQGTRLARGYCTDKTWKSSSCPQFCLTERPDYQNNAVELQHCKDSSYCCGQQANCNCTTGANTLNLQGPYSILGQVTIYTNGPTATPTSALTSSDSSNSSVAAPTSTETLMGLASSITPLTTNLAGQTGAANAISTATTSTSPSPAAGLSSGAKAGVGLGVIGAVMAFVAVGFVVWRNRQQKRKIDFLTSEMQSVSAMVKSPGHGGTGTYSTAGTRPSSGPGNQHAGASIVNTAMYPPSWHSPSPGESPNLTSTMATPMVVSPLSAGQYQPFRPSDITDGQQHHMSSGGSGYITALSQPPFNQKKAELHELSAE